MSTLNSVLQVITFLSCIAVIVITEPALNRVTLATPRCTRLSLLLICGGAVLLAAAILPGAMPTPWPGAAALVAGTALMLFTSRRWRVKQ